jgi:hypothetical protein
VFFFFGKKLAYAKPVPKACQGNYFPEGGIKSLRYEFMSNISLGLFFFEKNACKVMRCVRILV